MKRTKKKQNKKYLAVSLLFVGSLVGTVLGAALALTGTTTPGIALFAISLALLTVSLISVLIIVYRESNQKTAGGSMNGIEKATLAAGVSEILLYVFLTS